MYKTRRAVIESLPNSRQRNVSSNQGNVDLKLRVKELSAHLKATNLETEAFSCSVAHELRGPFK